MNADLAYRINPLHHCNIILTAPIESGYLERFDRRLKLPLSTCSLKNIPSESPET